MRSYDMSMGRYDTSVEGWSAVDKVAQFSHAVGRVSGGRGSAILIAVMDSQGQLVDHTVHQSASRAHGVKPGHGNTPADTASLRYNARGSRDSFRSASHVSSASFEAPSHDDDSGRRAHDTHQPPLGVLLTTSHVLCTPEEAETATVTFLDQLGLMTAAVLGHDPKPVRVPLRGAYGFVTSSAESNEHSAKYRRGAARGSTGSGSTTAARESLRDEPDYLLYRYQDPSDDDEVEDVGFALTFCDIYPEPAEPISATGSPPTTPRGRARGNAAAAGSNSNSNSSSARGGGGGVLNRGRSGSSESGLNSNASRATSPATSSMQPSSQNRFGSSSRHSASSHADDGGFGSSARRHAASEADSGVPAGSFHRHSSSSHSHANLHHTPSTQHTNARSGGNNLMLVQPLPVPLLLSTIPDVAVGDAHLMITHVNDGRRCYRVQHVSAVHPDYCEYKLANLSEDTCSGGAVFNAGGDFIGIQHERNGHSICLLMKSIVRNLFESDLLGMCRSPISEASVKKREPHARTGESLGGYSPKASFKRSFRSPRSISLPESPAGGTASPRTSGTSPGVPYTASAPATSHFNSAFSSPFTTTPLSQLVPNYEAVFNEFYSGFDSLSHILYAFPYCRQLLKLALENLSQLKYGNELDQMSTIGGVGAILETIDGYPQDEAIVSGALSAMCRICIYERNLTMFLHLDGVMTTMEIMKEYVHQPTILQWGTYLLVSATDPAQPSAVPCTEAIVQSSGPQLFVNVLRVHGAVQRKSAVRHLQHNRLLRWTCDLIANLLLPDRHRTTLFSREDFLTLLLQLMHDYTGNLFLIEGFVHVFCVFVLCFADLDPGEDPHGSPLICSPAPQKLQPTFSHTASTMSPAERFLSAQLSTTGVSQLARGGLASPYSTAGDPHKVCFFFLCQAALGDSDGCFLRSLLDVCESAMDAKSAVTAHRGRPETVLRRCFETLRVLLSWGLVRLRRPAHHAGRAAPGPGNSFSSLLDSHPQADSVGSSSLQMSAPSEELVRLRLIIDALKTQMPSSLELHAQIAEVDRLIKEQG